LGRAVARSSFFWILTVLIALTITFSIITPSGTFLSFFNLQSILADASVLLILAAAATLVIVSGGLDLSIGSVLTFSAVVGVLVMKEIGLDAGWGSILLGAAAAVGAGVAWGLLNGALIAYARLSPFVVTLGALGAALGAARLLVEGRSPSGTPPEFQDTVGLGEVVGLPVTFVIGGTVILWMGIVLAKTRFGEHVYLIGSNEEAARRGGIAVTRHKLVIYAISGGLAGVAGVVDVSRFDTASVATGHTLELIAAIAAVIIGGASLAGGVGSMAGTAVGVFIPVVLSNGFVILGVQRFWQDFVVGFILIAAVWFDQRRKERPPAVRDELSDGPGSEAPVLMEKPLRVGSE
jgi:ribose transport system permease protein